MTGQTNSEASSGGPSSSAAPELKTAAHGAMQLVTLDRPQALNALTHAMRARLGEVLTQASREPNTYCVVIQSSSPKAFSAGSDVREIVAAARHDMVLARQMFADEYARNWHCECFSKPTVSLIDGLVMGGGVGISLYGTHRVAGEGYRFAMPETAIGLFPDVGICHAFARMPDHIGTYLGLTGRQIGRADAYRLGLVTHCIGAGQFDEIKTLLAAAEPVDAVLDERHRDPGEGTLDGERDVIATCFGEPDVEDILARLNAVTGSMQPWAASVAGELMTRSPLSLKVTLRHIQEAASLDLRDTLQRDYRLGTHFLAGDDFYEGTRAALIDKDGKPIWNPNSLEAVTGVMVDAYFRPLGPAEPVLPTRTDMQAARA